MRGTQPTAKGFNMKKLVFLCILISLATGCTAMGQSTKKDNLSAKLQQPHTKKTSLLHYTVNPKYMVQMMAVVAGRFQWENGCIYLHNGDRKFTAIFPDYPTDSVRWNESEHILTLSNSKTETEVLQFRMGDSILTNGYYVNYNPDLVAVTAPENRKCLSSDGAAMVGTINMEKR